MDMGPALETLGTLLTTALGWIEDNSILMTMFVGGLVPTAFMIVRKAKKASKA